MYTTWNKYANSRTRRAITRTAVIGIAIIVIIAIVIAGYVALTATTSTTTSTTTSSTTSSTTSTTTSTNTSLPAEIRIGVLEPLTGFASEYGITDTAAAQYAASIINSAGGIHGMQIAIYSADEGSGGTQTINAFNELVLQDHVNFIIGTDFSGDLEAILSLIVKYHVITLSPSNSLNALHTLIGVNNATSYNEYKYYFTLNYNDTYAGTEMVDQMAVPMHATSVYITGEDYQYAHEVGAGAAAEAQAKGISVVGQSYFPGTALDFSSEILNIASLKPSLVILMATGSDEETFIGQMKQNPSTSTIPIMAGPCCGDLNDPRIVHNLLTSGTSLNYVAVQGYYYSMNLSSKSAAFVQGWLTTYGAYPNMYLAGTAYDAVGMFAQAVNETGSLNPDTLVSALESMTYNGVTGTIKFNNQNAVEFPPYTLPLFEFVNSRAEVFYPSSIANSTYIAPSG